MSDTSALEGMPLWKLTDRQVLDAMRGRGNELETAKSMAFLCRMFEKAAETNPACAPGLLAAVGLTQLYAVSMAPGHEAHPFKGVDKNMTVASILDGSAKPVLNTYKPPPVMKRGPLVRVEQGSMECRLPSVQNVPREPKPITSFSDPRLPGNKPEREPKRKFKSKLAIVGDVAMEMFAEMGPEGTINARGLHARCPSHILYQDVQNGMVALRKAGKITVDRGMIRLLVDAA